MKKVVWLKKRKSWSVGYGHIGLVTSPIQTWSDLGTYPSIMTPGTPGTYYMYLLPSARTWLRVGNSLSVCTVYLFIHLDDDYSKAKSWCVDFVHLCLVAKFEVPRQRINPTSSCRVCRGTMLMMPRHLLLVYSSATICMLLACNVLFTIGNFLSAHIGL